MLLWKSGRMFQWLRNLFGGRKSLPAVLAGGQWSGTSYADSYKRLRNPTPNELMAELKNTAWSCISHSLAPFRGLCLAPAEDRVFSRAVTPKAPARSWRASVPTSAGSPPRPWIARTTW